MPSPDDGIRRAQNLSIHEQPESRWRERNLCSPNAGNSSSRVNIGSPATRSQTRSLSPFETRWRKPGEPGIGSTYTAAMTSDTSTATIAAPSESEQLDYLRSMREIRFLRRKASGCSPRARCAARPISARARRPSRSARACAAPHRTRWRCTYRGHGAVLAMGAPLERAFGEIMGKARRTVRRQGRLDAPDRHGVGAMGSFAIVGAHLPIANGSASPRGTAARDASACASSATARPTSAPSTRR